MENKQNKSNKNIIPQYDVYKQNYSTEEKILLNEIRENLVDLAISSGENFQVNEDKLLNDIKVFLFNRYSGDIQNKNISNEYLDTLSMKLLKDIIGYGKIDPLIQDDELEEIMIIGVDKPIYVYHRKYGMMKTNIQFNDEQELLDLIDSMAREINRRIDQESPILDGRLNDGSRINATIPPASADGPSLTIRKFKRDPLTIIDLINSKTISIELAAFFWLCFDGLGVKSANAIISGGTSSGKTTTLNALSAFIPPKDLCQRHPSASYRRARCKSGGPFYRWQQGQPFYQAAGSPSSTGSCAPSCPAPSPGTSHSYAPSCAQDR